MDKKRTSVLVFVYNAEGGFFNSAADMAHKMFSPQTYQCKLCALTFSTFGMRKDWVEFLASLERSLEFLHSDELKNLYGISDLPLPAIFEKEGEQLKLLIDADSINRCSTIADLKQLIIGTTRG
jgi:hypothetical protein